jgi:hypothetical protein
VRHLEAEDAGDPVAGLADFPLMTTRTKMPRFAGEGEEPLVSAVRALEARESGGKVAAVVELADDVDGVVAEGAVNGAVAVFVACLEVGPGMMDDLPERRGAGAARSVDGGHDNCSGEQLSLNYVHVNSILKEDSISCEKSALPARRKKTPWSFRRISDSAPLL